jgi:hypothetical protein
MIDEFDSALAWLLALLTIWGAIGAWGQMSW